MEEYGYLLFIAIVLISTKCLGLVTKRFHMPQVVGALVAGLIIGTCLPESFVHCWLENPFYDSQPFRNWSYRIDVLRRT